MADELNFLIVGGLSYIGLHIMEYLLEKYPNIKLTILDLSSNTACTNEILKKVENYRQQCVITIGSPGNSELVTKLLKEYKINNVLYNIWNDDVNDIATKNDHPGCFRKTLSCMTQFLEILRCHENLTKFILISSEEVYGKQTVKLETIATKPCSLKGAAINACEMMLRSYLISYRLPAVIVRLSAVIYGGLMDDNSLLQLKQVDDNGKSGTVGLLHIRDAVVGIGSALEHGRIGEVYNIGGECDCSPDFLQLIPKLKRGEISSDKINISPLTMPSTKAEVELFWKAKILQSDGMREIIDKNENQQNEMNSASTHKILIYGTDFALKRLSRLIENKKRYLPESMQKEDVIIANQPAGDIDINEIIDISPSHIIYIFLPNTAEALNCDPNAKVDSETNIPTRVILKSKLYTLPYAPWFLASFCNKRSIHFTYLTSYSIYDESFFCNNHTIDFAEVENILCYNIYDYLMAINIFADRLLQQFDNVLFCRAGLMLDKDDDLDKMTCFALDPPLYLCLLSNSIPLVLDLALKRHTGMAEISNDVLVDDYDFRELCNQGNRPFGASIKFLSNENKDSSDDDNDNKCTDIEAKSCEHSENDMTE
ncbi:NAD dependent epimerase/dehydratase family protein [Brugia pahangi]